MFRRMWAGPLGTQGSAPRTPFGGAYATFAERLELPYRFVCDICGENPDVLIGDATAVTIQGGRYQGRIAKLFPWPYRCL